MDSPLVAASSEEKVAARFYDLIVASDRYHAVQWKELMAREVVALPVSGCDPDYHRAIPMSEKEKSSYESEVCFVGGLVPDRLYRERVEMLESITDLPLSIWTNDKELVLANPKLAPHYRGSAQGLEMIKVIGASKIALNNHGCTIQNGGNMRTFEVTSIGTFQLIDRYDGSWFDEGKEIVSYSNFADLRLKISHFLDQPEKRQCIAAEGQRRAWRQHTYQERMRSTLEILAGLD
ncbi:MAG: glycosyltransferase [Acidobacteriota bacterium]